MRKAVANINGEIAAAVKGQELTQRALDEAMIALDGTPTKSRLGANALLGVSMAAMRANAAREGKPLYAHIAELAGNKSGYVLPVPMMNILNGGAHADSNVDFQEFMVMPIGFPSFSEGLRAGTEIFHALRSILKGRTLSTGVGDEGGFAPSLKSNREALDVVMEAIGKAGARPVRTCSSRSMSPRANSGRHGRYEFNKSGEPARDSQGDGRALRRLVQAVPDHLDRGRLRRAGLGRLEDADARRSAARSSWSETTCSSPTRRS